jgi:hypothetical protein
MPKVELGILDGLRGKAGNSFYFRVINGKTYMSAMPRKRSVKKDEMQKECSKFRLAIDYASLARSNEALVELYKVKATGFNSVYTMAIADFMKAPEIESVYHRNYTGQPGNEIRIRVKNLIRVQTVIVSIVGADGIQIEEGEAVLLNHESRWNYQAVAVNPKRAGTTLKIMVKDFPGNVVNKDIVL